VAVLGPWADSLRLITGGWTVSWQGPTRDDDLPFGTTIVGALRKVLGSGVTVEYHAAIDDQGREVESYEDAVDAARTSDLVVVVIGEPVYTEKPGDIPDLSLPEGMQDLLLQVTSGSVPVVLVMTMGRPRVLGQSGHRVDAVVWSPLPGPEGGRAIAEVLVGQTNPSGRLPLTWPRFSATFMPYYRKFSQNPW